MVLLCGSKQILKKNNEYIVSIFGGQADRQKSRKYLIWKVESRCCIIKSIEKTDMFTEKITY